MHKKQELQAKDIAAIKKVAVGLLTELKQKIEEISQWRQRESTRDAVRLTIYDYLWNDTTGVPIDSFDEDDINEKTDAIFQHVYQAYPTIPSPIYGASA